MLWAAAVALVISTTPPSEATSPQSPAPALVSVKRAFCIYTGCFLEPLIPDLRREWGSREGWVLAWPLHPLPMPYFDLGALTLYVSPFLEPQVALHDGGFRALVGTRVSLFPGRSRAGLFLEGAASWAAEGFGAVTGAGLSYDLVERHSGTFPWTLSAVYRRSFFPGGASHDVSLDVTVPLPLFTGVRPWGEKG